MRRLFAAGVSLKWVSGLSALKGPSRLPKWQAGSFVQCAMQCILCKTGGDLHRNCKDYDGMGRFCVAHHVYICAMQRKEPGAIYTENGTELTPTWQRCRCL